MKVTNQSGPNTQLIENKATEKVQGGTDLSKKQSGVLGKNSGDAGNMVEISDNARLMQRAVEVAKQAPEGRAEKIASLKKSVQDGTYKVDARQIADKLVEEHLGSDFGKNNL